MKWEDKIDLFIKLSNKHKVKMLMVGGGATNFHGYQRHSADVDFWIDTTTANFDKLIFVFNEMEYDISEFPHKVINQLQNISIKFSPMDLNLQLITRFSVNKTFDEAYKDSEETTVNNQQFLKYNVLSLEDLITSKIKANRPKDLLDIQELKKINKLK